MTVLTILPVMLMTAAPLRFERHEIDKFPGGYQVAVADINGDGKPDVVALSTDAGRVDWYENPTWKRRPVARVDHPIDLAIHDIDGDGRPEIALAYGFYFNQSNRGGQIAWLKPKASLDDPWEIHPIATDPVVHRLRWADLDGDGRKELVHAPIFGPGSNANLDPKPSHLWAFRPPKDLAQGKWEVWKIDESLTVLHGIWVGRNGVYGKHDILLTASYEGLTGFEMSEPEINRKLRKTPITPGAGPVDQKPGAARGSSEVAYGQLGRWQFFLTAIEPWHGHQVVVYHPVVEANSPALTWRRQVLDETLSEGHALVTADFNGDGRDEIIAGWRGAGGGLSLYEWDGTAEKFQKKPLDRGIAVEGAVAADINGDGKLDLVAIAGRTNQLVWYENKR